jgi:hypothetical protein
MKPISIKTWKSRSRLFVAIQFLAGCGAAGGVKVAVQQDKYSPGFRASDAGRSRASGSPWPPSSPGGQHEDLELYTPTETGLRDLDAPGVVLLGVLQQGFRMPAPGSWTTRRVPYHGPVPGGGAAPAGRRPRPEGRFRGPAVLTSVTDQEVRFQSTSPGRRREIAEGLCGDHAAGRIQDVKDLEKRAYEWSNRLSRPWSGSRFPEGPVACRRSVPSRRRVVRTIPADFTSEHPELHL